MATLNELHMQGVNHLKAASGTPHPLLTELIHAIPPFKNPNLLANYRGAIADLLKASLPNSSVATPPGEQVSGGRSMVTITYTHQGSYTGYRDLFFPGSSRTPAATAVAAAVQGVDSRLDNGWWERYAIAALTDAIRARGSGLNLNVPKLNTDIPNFGMSLRPALSASYLAVFREGYGPTAAACRNINGTTAVGVLADLKSRLGQPSFAGQMNYLLEQPGDSSVAAEWLLFNMWIVLTVLGEKDVGHCIMKFKDACPNLPNSIGAARWWNGGYTTWVDTPPYGSELLNAASGVITAHMPLIKTRRILGTLIVPETKEPVSIPSGFAQSFCYYGAHNWYKP